MLDAICILKSSLTVGDIVDNCDGMLICHSCSPISASVIHLQMGALVEAPVELVELFYVLGGCWVATKADSDC